MLNFFGRRQGNVCPHEEGGGLRIALVSDAFTFLGLSMECRVRPVSPKGWKKEVSEFEPQLLLVESCWYGLAGEWKGLVHTTSRTLRNLVSYCRRRGIPTVFWSKEDPVHWRDFLETAKLFDHVFTTDVECIERYRSAIGHTRVGLMTFAVQPKLHNPVSAPTRIRGSCFAGAWYGNFGARCEQFTELALGLRRAGPFHVYRRRSPDGQHEDYPALFSQHLRDQVPYEKTGDLYRSYEIGLSINTVTRSPTMFARRAVELMACGTRVFSNRSLAMEQLFGPHVECFANAAEIEHAATQVLALAASDDERLYRLRALRCAHEDHAWSVRLREMLEVVMGSDPRSQATPDLVVVAKVSSQRQLDLLAGMVAAQRRIAPLCMVDAPGDCVFPDGITMLGEDRMALGLGQVASDDAVFVPIVAGDWYGPDYLRDLVTGLGFGASAAGKACYKTMTPRGEVATTGHGLEYQCVDSLAFRRSAFRATAWNGSLGELLGVVETGALRGSDLISLDAMSYIEDGVRSEDRVLHG